MLLFFRCFSPEGRKKIGSVFRPKGEKKLSDFQKNIPGRGKSKKKTMVGSVGYLVRYSERASKEFHQRFVKIVIVGTP